MALAVESPARSDLSFRSNDDKRVGARWLKSDGTTPVDIDSAVVTLRFDPVPVVYDEDGNPPLDAEGEPLPIDPPEEHVIDSVTPDDAAGWVDASALTSGVVLVTVPHGIWSDYEMSSGVWDMVAVGEGVQRCLVRGRFVVEAGVSA
jgi:hypothetical protein